MSGVNRMIIVGNLGKDPEVKTTQNGKKVVNLSVATSRTWRDRESGERKESTQWHKVVVFNETLVEEASHLRKGQKVYVEGSMEYRTWEAPDGKKMYFSELVLRPFGSNIANLERSTGGDMGQSEHNYDEGATHWNDTGRDQITDGAQPRRPARNADLDDDIPF